jgi:2-keto-4-pentenoate hydratase/2-oxohepta-3-ene-1,7-dioic acid hydratase in catechol pathway
MPATPQFALGTFSDTGSQPFMGLVVNEHVVALSAFAAQGLAASGNSMVELLDHWAGNLPILERAAQTFVRHVATPVSELQVHAPYTNPRQILCVGANYRKHVVDIIISEARAEGMSPEQAKLHGEQMMDERAASGDPYAWTKANSAITGPFDPIVIPRDVKQPDWELELGIIIGKQGYRISRDAAMSHIAGYAITNDVTARDMLYRKDMPKIGTDWLNSKCRPSFLPFGPYIVPRQFVADPQNMQITFKLNGKAMQDESTADMLFKIPRLIEYLSSLVTLYPGDLICTGSPAGNGAHHGRFFQPGDVAESTITGLGLQRNPCVAES